MLPITFLDKYNPDQFEILGCSYDYGRPDGWSEDINMSVSVGGENVYKRILIQHKNKGRSQ
ncbi:MAG: adenine-specific methyltransferase EcoRI family protein [Candidatus Aquirickettsiella gammari]